MVPFISKGQYSVMVLIETIISEVLKGTSEVLSNGVIEI